MFSSFLKDIRRYLEVDLCHPCTSLYFPNMKHGLVIKLRQAMVIKLRQETNNSKILWGPKPQMRVATKNTLWVGGHTQHSVLCKLFVALLLDFNGLRYSLQG